MHAVLLYIVLIYIVLGSRSNHWHLVLQVAGIIGHWIVLSTIDCANHEVKIYNSLYNSINEDTLIAITVLLKVNMFPHKYVHIMHMAIQYGDTEYGLYAIATIVCLVFGDDPCNHSGETCFTNRYA